MSTDNIPEGKKSYGEDIAENNKRIAKNTLYMYFRMGITLIVSLFTARVVLNALGVHDYGLLNVVGGFVGLLAFVNSLLSQGTSRFLTVALGRGDEKRLKEIFSACLTMHLFIALFTLLVGETVGLWFVNNKLVIEPSRMFACNIVYQLSLFSMFLGIMQAPYSATVISHERMSAFAYMSIFDVVMKLVIIYLLLWFDGDKLILYSSFYFLVGLTTMMIYRIYCLRNFSECGWKFGFDKQLYKDIFNYIGWNAIGTLAFILNGQGVSVMLNMFFGTIVNTARGIAMNVCGHLSQFVGNFQTAVNPQTMKYYASGNVAQMNRLVMNNAKYSSYLLMIVCLPVFIETRYILQLWLGQVPQYTVEFIRITICQMMVSAIDTPIGIGIHAYGKMRLPNITSSLIYLSALPLSYVAMSLGASPVVAYIIVCSVYLGALVCDLWILNKYSGFNVGEYVRRVILHGVCMVALCAVLPGIVHFSLDAGLLRFIVVCVVSVLSSCLVVYYLGLSSSMRKKVTSKVRKMIHK